MTATTVSSRPRSGFSLFSQDPPPPGRSLSDSIWAPQSQNAGLPWPACLQTSQELGPRTEIGHGFQVPHFQPPQNPSFSNDDFDPVGVFDSTALQPKCDLGAIGDGRSMHVAQLLRTLDLNSPAPPASLQQQIQPFTLGIGTSPEVSPCSASSTLLTPVDSPTRIHDFPLKPAFDLDSCAAPSSVNLGLDGSGVPHRNVISPLLNLTSSLPVNHYAPLSRNSNVYANPTPECGNESRQLMSTLGGLQAMGQTADFSAGIDLMRRVERVQPTTELFRQEGALCDRVVNVVTDGTSGRPPSFNASMFSPSPCNPLPLANHEPINFLSLLHPSSSPPYALFVSRIIKSSDQQASIFLQQKLKVADAGERGKIIDAICARGFDMMAHRFGNWAVQRCLEAASTTEERRKIVNCMRGRVVELAMNCYGCHVLQKALDCEEEVRLQIVSELLLGDPAQTLVNKHASHVWSKIMELNWTPPAPPIFAYVNSSLKGKWASLACHETGSLVVQHAFENLEEPAKDGIIDELLNQGPVVFSEVAKNQWGSYCIQHILEHGSSNHRQMALEHIIVGLLDFATNEQGSKSVTKALKEGGKDTLNRVVKRMAEPTKGGRRAIIVDLALSATGSQLIATVLPNIDKDQRTLLYDAIRGHIVTLRGCKTGSKVIWLFDRMRAYYGY